MAFSKIIFNGTTLMDVTQDTVAADNLLQGETATGADGEQVTGAYVPSGGQTDASIESGAIFIDYDGNIVEEWEASTVAGKTALPSNPSHTGLTAQGWNWSLADIKTWVSGNSEMLLTVGQNYVTTSGKTEIDITLNANSLHPYLGIAPNGTVSINWGDGSTSSVTGTSTSTLKWADHTYSAAGDYTIQLTPTNAFGFYNSNYMNGGVLSRSSSFGKSWEYSSCITAIRIGTGVSITGTGGLAGLSHLKTITIPTSLTTWNSSAFSNAILLSSITIPSGVTSVPAYCFYVCSAMRHVSIPKSVTSIGNYALHRCTAIKTVSLPTGVTSIGNYSFGSSPSITKINIPNGVTTISQYALYNLYALQNVSPMSGVTTFATYAFAWAYSLTSITIPASTTSIAAYAFSELYSLKKLRFNRASPPTVSASTAFNLLPTTCVISVPVGSLSSYTSASNYPSSSSYTYIEEA